MDDKLSEVIAEREFETYDRDGQLGHTILLRVSKPQIISEENHKSWYCFYQIIGIGDEEGYEGRGGDSMQALMLSLRRAQAQLKFYAKHNHMKIKWFGQDDLDLPDSGY